jgi:DnaK suppressor protein
MLEKEQIEILKEKLLKKKKEIEEEIKKLEKEAKEEATSDIYDEQDEFEEVSNIQSTENIFQVQLAEISLALEKIKNNSYGICERCQKPISFSLLNKVPESKYCRSCKLLLKIFKK